MGYKEIVERVKSETFRDQALRELDTVFFKEFSELCRVEGQQIRVVIDNNSFVKLKEGQILGMVQADILLMAKTADLPPAKAPGGLLNVNGREYIVESWGSDTGFTEIALRQNRTA